MKKEKTQLTVPSYSEEPTSDKDIVRLVDREGNWTHYKKLSTGRIVPAVNYILSNGFNKGARFQNWLLSQREDEAKKILESAGDRGSRVHMAIRDLINGNEVKIDSKFPSDLQKGRFETLTNQEWDCIRGFVNWQNDHKPEVVAQEVAIWSEKEGYAGTADFLGTIQYKGLRVPVLADWKSSSGLWDEYKLQVAAYYQAYYEMAPHGQFLPISTVLVRVGTRHRAKYEMELFDAKETMGHQSRFLEVKNLCEFVNPPKSSEPEIEQIPVSFKIDVPKWKPEAKSSRKTQNKTNKTNVGQTNQRSSGKVRGGGRGRELLQAQGGQESATNLV